MKNLPRCVWCPLDDPLYVKYHDEEWGVPVHDGQKLFEMLNLEGAQAGLSWRTVLHKRENYYRVFEKFDARKLLRWRPAQIEKALKDPGIIRNRLKVNAVVTNAKAYEEHFKLKPAAFSDFLWSFVDGTPIPHHFRKSSDFLSTTPESDAMSAALRRMGFKFIGSTICYAFMQAVGMVDDHSVDCFLYSKKRKANKSRR